VGPNLTDNFWIHGKGTRLDIVGVLKTGVLEKGMPAWEAVFTRDELLAVSAFVFSMKGKQPKTAKEPQGQEVVLQ
jgi:cytochrome c oxidase cbb3-type subunit 3